MFFLKQSKQTHQQTFDQSSLQITIQHGQNQLQQVRLSYKWASTHLNFRLPVMRCQWFNKSAHSMDLIEGVEGESYQPSIIDVGTTLYIQMVPQSKDMEYIGMPLTKFIGPLQLASETEEQVTQLIQAGKSTYFVEVKEIKIAKLNLGSQGGLDIRDALLKIVKKKMILMGKLKQGEKAETIRQILISKDYPKLVIQRGNAKLLIVKFGEGEWARLQLQNNKIRDVLYLLVMKIRDNEQFEIVQQKKQEINVNVTSHNPQGQIQLKQTQNNIKNQIPENGINVQHIREKQLQINIAEDREKKALQRLPLSPQSKQISKQKTQLIFSQTKLKLSTLQDQNLSVFRQNNASLEKEVKILKQSVQKLTDNLKKLSAQKFQSQQQACYFKNECRIQHQQVTELKALRADVQAKLDSLTLKTSINLTQEESHLKYGSYLSLNFQQLLDLVLNRQENIKQQQRKLAYHIQHYQQLQNDAKDLSDKLQTSQTTIKKLQRKIQSLIESKHIIQQPTADKHTHTHTHQLGSYQFEISKLKEELNILQGKRKEEGESNEQMIISLRIQIKELIQQNTYLRSKEKSSKGELKNQLVQLKKLINRFAESIAEKDMQIDHLKQANKELGKALQAAKGEQI